MMPICVLVPVVIGFCVVGVMVGLVGRLVGRVGLVGLKVGLLVLDCSTGIEGVVVLLVLNGGHKGPAVTTSMMPHGPNGRDVVICCSFVIGSLVLNWPLGRNVVELKNGGLAVLLVIGLGINMIFASLPNNPGINGFGGGLTSPFVE
jgi:hypothetical protein